MAPQTLAHIEKMMSVAILKKCLEMYIPKIFDFLFFSKRPMCLKHDKYYIRMTFSLFAKIRKLMKKLPNTIQKISKSMKNRFW